MKRLLVLATALALVLGTQGFVLAEGDMQFKNASELCKYYDDFGKSHGECVSIMQNCFNRGSATPVCICKVWELLFPVSFYDNYENLGLCVSGLRVAPAD